jgi:surface antigen
MPASTPWWSTPSTAAPRPGRRPTLGLAAAIVASVLSGATMADPLKTSAGTRQASAPAPAGQAMPYATYTARYGIDRGTCDRAVLARRMEGSAGALVGARIGQSMDQVDQACVARILEFAPDRAAVRWYGAPRLDYGGPAFAITPLRTFERDGQFCRDYQALATVGGQDEQIYGTACRMTDGVWRQAG